MRPLLLALGLMTLSPAGISAPLVSPAPLLALSQYIDKEGACSESVMEWNRRHLGKVVSGESSRSFYFRAITFQNWGSCGQPFQKRVFSELQKSWQIFSLGKVTVQQYESKEMLLINLLLAALRAGADGESLVVRYEENVSSRLFELVPDLQYFNCTYFGDDPRCID